MVPVQPSPPEPGSAADPVLAAGVVLWTGTPEAPRFLLLQNRRHGTWGFAKGHLETGEDLQAGALREVLEETGIALQAEHLDPTFADTSIYRPDDDAWKRVVTFLAADPIEEAAFTCSAEHQDHAWLPEADAVDRLAFSDLRRTLIRAATRLADRAQAAAPSDASGKP